MPESLKKLPYELYREAFLFYPKIATVSVYYSTQ